MGVLFSFCGGERPRPTSTSYPILKTLSFHRKGKVKKDTPPPKEKSFLEELTNEVTSLKKLFWKDEPLGSPLRLPEVGVWDWVEVSSPGSLSNILFKGEEGFHVYPNSLNVSFLFLASPFSCPSVVHMQILCIKFPVLKFACPISYLLQSVN